MSLEIKKFFDSIKEFRYFVTKIETPFFSDSFPEEYPVGRDVDIVVHPKDFDKICCRCEEHVVPFDSLVRRLAKDSRNHYRYRIESLNYFLRPNPAPYDKLIHGLPMTKLHFQVDICSIIEEEFNCFSYDFIAKAFDNLEFKNGVKVLSKDKEFLLRLLFWKKSPSAIHHLDFIKQNKNPDVIQFFKDEEMKDFSLRILEELEKESA